MSDEEYEDDFDLNNSFSEEDDYEKDPFPDITESDIKESKTNVANTQFVWNMEQKNYPPIWNKWKRMEERVETKLKTGTLTAVDVLTATQKFVQALTKTLTKSEQVNNSSNIGLFPDLRKFAIKFNKKWQWQYLVLADITRSHNTGKQPVLYQRVTSLLANLAMTLMMLGDESHQGFVQHLYRICHRLIKRGDPDEEDKATCISVYKGIFSFLLKTKKFKQAVVFQRKLSNLDGVKIPLTDEQMVEIMRQSDSKQTRYTPAQAEEKNSNEAGELSASESNQSSTLTTSLLVASSSSDNITPTGSESNFKFVEVPSKDSPNITNSSADADADAGVAGTTGKKSNQTFNEKSMTKFDIKADTIPSASTLSPENKTRNDQIRYYLVHHKIPSTLNALVQMIACRQPDDPFNAMADILEEIYISDGDADGVDDKDVY